MYELPTTITINGTIYTIRLRGDYRVVLDCFAVLNDVELTQQERTLACLLIFIEDFNEIEDVLSINEENLRLLIDNTFLFFNCGQPDCPSAKMNFKTIDWEKDAQLISSAVNKVAGKEIRTEPYMHWWTFMGYFNAVGESALSTVVGIRTKIAKNETLEKYERKFRADNPQYFSWDMRTLQQKEEDELLNQIWNRGD
jgi:hypothetical protein